MRKYVTPIVEILVEIFRLHPSGLKVSNFGRVLVPKSGVHKEHITYGHEDKDGYLRVKYQGKVYLVHRLVAECFIPNPENKPEIDHINRNKQDNRVENLRWATRSDNSKNRGKYTRPNQSKNTASSKIVLQYTKSGEFVREWPSLMEVKRQLGFYQGNISKCCNGKRYSANGYIWKYKKDED